MEQDHPFKPGLRVALTSRYSDTPREGFVDKVHKSGRFTLVGSTQQWRPSRFGWSDGQVEWSAHATGDNWDREGVRVWDAETDKAVAQEALADRVAAVRKRLERFDPEKLTEATVDALEAALEALVKP